MTRDYERVTAGLVLLPAVAAMGTTLALTARFGRRGDRKFRLTLGLAGMVLGTWALGRVDLYTDKFWIAAVMAGWAASTGLVASPLICISQENMTPAQVASSSGIKNLMLVLPAFLGNNLVGIFIERRGDAHFDSIRQSIVPNRPPWDDVRLGVIDTFTLLGAGPAEAASAADRLLGQWTLDNATVFAYQSAFQILAATLTVAIVLACLLRPLPPQAPGPLRG